MNSLNLLIGLARGRVPGQLVIQLTDRCNGRLAPRLAVTREGSEPEATRWREGINPSPTIGLP